MLNNHVQSHRRVLIGFDFPYGYPSEWHTRLGLVNDGGWQRCGACLHNALRMMSEMKTTVALSPTT